MDDIGYTIGWAAGFGIGLAGYIVTFLVMAEAIRRYFRR